MYADVIREVNRAGQIVWEWHARDHLRPEDFPIAAGFGRYHWRSSTASRSMRTAAR